MLITIKISENKQIIMNMNNNNRKIKLITINFKNKIKIYKKRQQSSIHKENPSYNKV